MEKIDLVDFPMYSITKDGRIYNGAMQLKHQFQANGSPFVRLRHEGKYYSMTVAKLVAITFIYPPRNETDVVNYKDGNNHNVHVDNLYWNVMSLHVYERHFYLIKEYCNE